MGFCLIFLFFYLFPFSYLVLAYSCLARSNAARTVAAHLHLQSVYAQISFEADCATLPRTAHPTPPPASPPCASFKCLQHV